MSEVVSFEYQLTFTKKILSNMGPYGKDSKTLGYILKLEAFQSVNEDLRGLICHALKSTYSPTFEKRILLK